MEVPSSVRRSKIASKFTFDNPTGRHHLSKKGVNGWGNQRFTSDDCPKAFNGIFIREEKDSKDETVTHPSYLIVASTKPWVPFGLRGWNACGELDLITRKLWIQKHLKVRSAREEDLGGLKMPKGKFWLAEHSFDIDENGAHFCMKYVDNGIIKLAELCRVHGSEAVETEGDVGAGLLAVVTIDTIVINDLKLPSLWS